MKKSFELNARRELLLVYWLHLIIIWGAFWGDKSLAGIIVMTNSVFKSSITKIFLLLFC